jgi:diguanylate cyclase (GGDEF)-like protein
VIEAASLRLPSGQVLELTISVGVASAVPADATPADLLAAADRALYEAKGAGRNRVSVTRR